MAVDLQLGTDQPVRGMGRLGKLLSSIIHRTAEEPLLPRGFYQFTLAAGASRSLGDVMRSQGKTTLPGLRTIVVNVEGFAVRYCDADTAAPGYGELYAAGSAFARSFRGVGTATFAADATNGGTATINVSVYGEPVE